VPHKQKTSSSQAAWALLTQGVTTARLESHRLRHILSRVLQLVEDSDKKEHLYQVAGDLIMEAPERLQKLEIVLDRTSLALSEMGEDFLSARLPLSEKQLILEAIKPANGKGYRESVDRVARKWAEKSGDGRE